MTALTSWSIRLQFALTVKQLGSADNNNSWKVENAYCKLVKEIVDLRLSYQREALKSGEYYDTSGKTGYVLRTT